MTTKKKSVLGGDKPDITPIQLIALVGSILACASAFGLDLTAEQRDAISDLVKALVAMGALDTALRGFRNIGGRRQ